MTFILLYATTNCTKKVSEHKKSLFTSVLCGPVDEEIHSPDLSDLLLLSVKPEDLLAALLRCLALNSDSRPIVTKKKSGMCRVILRKQNRLYSNKRPGSKNCLKSRN